MKKTNQYGFTLIELMIATTVFSVFLLLITFMTIRIGKLFQKGVIVSRTQETARTISSEISRAIQFSGGYVAFGPSGTNYFICAGSQRYMYTLGHQLFDSAPTGTQVSHVLISDTSPACSTTAVNMAAFNPATQRELIPNRTRLSNLTIQQAGKMYTITVRVVYGDDDLLNNPLAINATCKGNQVGTEYCGMSELITTVQKRL